MILREIVMALERVEEGQRLILKRLDQDREHKVREENWGPRKAEGLCGERTSDGASETCRLRQGEGCKVREENWGPRKAEGLCGERTSDGASETCRLRQGEGCKVREDDWLQNGIDNILAYQAGKPKEE